MSNHPEDQRTQVVARVENPKAWQRKGKFGDEQPSSPSKLQVCSFYVASHGLLDERRTL